MAVVWIGIGAYLFSLGARQRKLEQRIDSLDRSEADASESSSSAY
jgi:CcmD family protein